jgi:hypothetical protein
MAQAQSGLQGETLQLTKLGPGPSLETWRFGEFPVVPPEARLWSLLAPENLKSLVLDL